MSRAKAIIHLDSILFNFQQVKKFARKSAILAMIKGNAYGHGIVEVAQTLQDAEAFGVASLEEGLILREVGITKPIVVMSGFINTEELNLISQHELTPVIHDWGQVRYLEEARLEKPLPIWIKIDSGMHRLGLAPETIPKLYEQLLTFPCLKKPFTWLTHLACADNLNVPEKTENQMDCFLQTVERLPGLKSVANSAGILSWPQTHLDWVRPGIMLYGASPFPEETGFDLGLKPAMTLQSSLIAIHQLKKGEAIGYGGIWSCPEDMVVGVAAIGYGDGYPRHALSGTPVLVNNQFCQLVGRVSMDMISIDLRHCPQAKIGDPVTLWGETLPAELIARSADTIAYELFCNVTNRVTRVVIGC